MSEETALAPVGTSVMAIAHGASGTIVSASPFLGASAVPFSKEEAAILARPLTDEEIQVRPDDGALYFPGVNYRRRLNEAFGMGGWAMIPAGPPAREESGKNPLILYTGRLYVHGRFIAEATGEAKFISNNAKSSYGSALESARTDCLTRCCKDFLAMELWDPTFAGSWKATHCRQIPNPDGYGAYPSRVWVKRAPPAPAPNVPKRAHNRQTGEEIVGAWPKPTPDPSVDKSREMDDDYRRAMDMPARTDLEVLLQRSVDENHIEVTDRKTGDKTLEVKATRPQLAKIHILQREMAIPEEDWRHGLKTYYGIDTSALLTRAQADDCIERLLTTKARVPAEMLKVLPGGRDEAET